MPCCLTSGACEDHRVVGGDLAWVVSAGGLELDEGSEVAVLEDGTVLVAGRFSCDAVFGEGGASEATLSAPCPEDPHHRRDTDLFLARYDEAGDLIWARTASGPLYESVRGLAGLPGGASLLAGNFDTSLTLGDREPGEVTLASVGTKQAFVARYEEQGGLDWAFAVDGSGSTSMHALSAFHDGAFVLAGVFQNSAIFGEGQPGQTALDAGESTSFFLARYDSEGMLSWATRIATGDFDNRPTDVHALADGTTLLAGMISGEAIFDPGGPGETILAPGSRNYALARYGADGGLMWARLVGGSQAHMNTMKVTGLADGSVAVVGDFTGEVIFGAGEPNETRLATVMVSDTDDDHDIFVARYSADGRFKWVRQGKGPAPDDPGAIAPRADGSMVISGTFHEHVTFGGGGAGGQRLDVIEDEDYTSNSYVAVYTRAGRLSWARHVAQACAGGLAALETGPLYLIGSFSETMIFGPGQLCETRLTASGGLDVFLMRLEP